MNKWDRYLKKCCTPDGRHKKFTNWKWVDTWIFKRDDGNYTAHKCEMPWAFWSDTAERCMQMLDTLFPMGFQDMDIPDEWPDVLRLWREKGLTWDEPCNWWGD